MILADDAKSCLEFLLLEYHESCFENVELPAPDPCLIAAPANNCIYHHPHVLLQASF